MTSTQTHQASPQLRPLNLLAKVPSGKLRIDVTSPTPSATLISITPPPWQKEFKLTRVVNRERKKLSTVTLSSNGSDSQSTCSRLPPTPSDLPVLNGQLCILEEKFEVVSNRISSRHRLFENLEKNSSHLHLDLQKELLNAIARENESNNQTDEDLSTKPSSPISNPKTEAGNQANGWGGYFKLW
ncbi:hypothetical protein CROQUDRAFT_659994 [Cronartium quercuum f. sp. fusiforme G11]|uniref:Uncharacterized protein n=1 Tax=Cronartium quercuum f. sp. fusiforme G11 TaxID=708437 RepID=A0A9P6NI27_9BASI|nr:hypothetical protein CROQUDRAFT_659994 [Cronartium quercuum f. sp. fusiforme G11]